LDVESALDHTWDNDQLVADDNSKIVCSPNPPLSGTAVPSHELSPEAKHVHGVESLNKSSEYHIHEETTNLEEISSTTITSNDHELSYHVPLAASSPKASDDQRFEVGTLQNVSSATDDQANVLEESSSAPEKDPGSQDLCLLTEEVSPNEIDESREAEPSTANNVAEHPPYTSTEAVHVEEPVLRAKKRIILGPDEWKQNKSKKLRESGQEYKSKDGTIKEPKELRPRCECSTKSNDCSLFTDEERQNIFAFVWNLTWGERKTYVNGLLEKKVPSRR